MKKNLLNNKFNQRLLGVFLLGLLPIVALGQKKITDIVVPEGKAVICVARGGDIRASWCDYPILLNQRMVFTLKRNTFGYIVVDPGCYTIVGSEEYKKNSYFSPESKINLITIDEGGFILLEFKQQLGHAQLFTSLEQCSSDKVFVKLDKECKKSKTNIVTDYSEDLFPIGSVMTANNYALFIAGNNLKAEQLSNNLLQISLPNNVSNPNQDTPSQSYEGTFNSSPGATMGTYTSKDSDGMYRVKAAINCTNCKGSGSVNIGGITSKCPTCGGSGRMGGGKNKYSIESIGSKYRY